VVDDLDILYMTRVQKERFDETEYQHMKSAFLLNASMLNNAKENLKVLHPLPRIDEINIDVDNTPYAYYFQQAQNGVFARQALLALLLTNHFQAKL
jgi:aspartate carbamoyltransferase catalytic subunit